MIRTTNTAIAINAIRERIVESCQLWSTSRVRVFVVMTTPRLMLVGCDQSDFLHEGFLVPHGAVATIGRKLASNTNQLASGGRRRPGPSSEIEMWDIKRLICTGFF